MNKKNNKPQFQALTTNLVGMVRNETLEGRSYVVVPMVMIVEGVLNGSNGPLYYPAEELAKIPQVWNHKPAVVYHPQMNGKALSACDPEVIENYKVGLIMNTTFDGKRLKAEAWLEPSRLAVVDNRVQEALDNNTMMEVSTGLFTENEMTEGEFNGTAYVGIARNYRPDHLAILPDQIGACSIQDGAGLLRLNSRQQSTFTTLLKRLHINSDMSHDDVRKALYVALSTQKDYNDMWIADVFDSYFIFESSTGLKKQEYTMDEGAAKLVGIPVDVQRVTSYEEMTSNQTKGEKQMDKQAIVSELIANGQWAETDREFLLGLNEDQLTKIKPVEDTKADKQVAKAKTVKPATNKDGDEDEDDEASNGAPAAKPSTNKQITVDDYLANAPAEIREVMNEAMQSQATRKMGLIATITANKKNVFTKEQLSSLSVNELEAIASLAKPDEEPTPRRASYAGQAPVGNAQDGSEDETPLEAPVMNFKKD